MEWRNGPRRPKRETELGGMASVLEGIWGSESIRFRRDVSETTKYIETAIVIDKAMFEKRNGSTRAEVIHDAIQVANIADLVRIYGNDRRKITSCLLVVARTSLKFDSNLNRNSVSQFSSIFVRLIRGSR